MLADFLFYLFSFRCCLSVFARFGSIFGSPDGHFGGILESFGLLGADFRDLFTPGEPFR